MLSGFQQLGTGVNSQKTSKRPSQLAVRVKEGMSLRNGMWHGLRNDITMAQKKKMAQTNKLNRKARASLPRLFWRQFEGATALLVHLLLLLKQG